MASSRSLRDNSPHVVAWIIVTHAVVVIVRIIVAIVVVRIVTVIIRIVTVLVHVIVRVTSVVRIVGVVVRVVVIIVEIGIAVPGIASRALGRLVVVEMFGAVSHLEAIVRSIRSRRSSSAQVQHAILGHIDCACHICNSSY